MTTGSYLIDTSVYEPNSGFWTGRKVSKSWSGADWPKVPKVPKRFETIIREIWDRKARRYVLRKIRIRIGAYTPKRVRSKEPHAYTMAYSRLDSNLFFSPVHNKNVPGFWYMSATGPGTVASVPLGMDANDQLKLVGRLTDQMAGSDFNMSVFLGELPQTLNLLADSAIRIAKGVHHLRRGDLTGTLRSLFEGTSRKPLKRHVTMGEALAPKYISKNSASIWLELQYGWLPLLKDAEGAAQAIAHAIHAPYVQTYKANVRKEVTIPNPRRVYGDNGWVEGSSVITKLTRRSLIAYITEDRSTGVLASLGVLDPELVLWELLPFSFVADWFIPIGQYLEQRAKASRLTGTFVTSEKSFCRIDKMVVNGQTLSDSGTWVTFDRTISSSLDVPMPTVKPLEKVASWQHCANALALVTGLWK